MGMKNDTPFIAHSELTDEIYVIYKKAKYCVTDQVMKAVVATNRVIPKDQYEARLKADMVAMLDKIRSEIEQLRLHKTQFLTSDNKVCIDSQEVLNIIDRYKAGSEETADDKD